MPEFRSPLTVASEITHVLNNEQPFDIDLLFPLLEELEKSVRFELKPKTSIENTNLSANFQKYLESNESESNETAITQSAIRKFQAVQEGFRNKCYAIVDKLYAFFKDHKSFTDAECLQYKADHTIKNQKITIGLDMYSSYIIAQGKKQLITGERSKEGVLLTPLQNIQLQEWAKNGIEDEDEKLLTSFKYFLIKNEPLPDIGELYELPNIYLLADHEVDKFLTQTLIKCSYYKTLIESNLSANNSTQSSSADPETLKTEQLHQLNILRTLAVIQEMANDTIKLPKARCDGLSSILAIIHKDTTPAPEKFIMQKLWNSIKIAVYRLLFKREELVAADIPITPLPQYMKKFLTNETKKEMIDAARKENIDPAGGKDALEPPINDNHQTEH